MRYAPRTISFLCDLHHPPRALDPRPVQKLHNEMFESGEPLYKSFHVTHEGAVLSNPVARPDAGSSVSFFAGRISFREELTGLTVEEFAKRLEQVASRAQELLGLMHVTAQQITVRTLVNPRRHAGGVAYMRDGLLRLSGEMEAFGGAQPQIYGLRLVFPATQADPRMFALRVESCIGDARSIFLENQGTFPPLALLEGGVERLAANVHGTYAFAVERVLEFVGRFDGERDAPAGGEFE